MITKEKLQALQISPACMESFLKYFPKGKVSKAEFFKTLTDVSENLTSLEREGLGWLAAHYPGFTFRELMCLIKHTENPARVAVAVAHCVKELTPYEREQLLTY